MRRGLVLVLVLALAGCGGVSRGDYVSHNESLVALLPTFPKAVKVHEISTPAKPSGYRTTVVYRVPRGTTDGSVVRFYRAQLVGRAGGGQRDQTAAETAQEIDAREPAPLAVGLEELRRLPRL